ncbi:GNAT family N-acetyltransferase [Marinicella sediminis]|uniref:GNAT family N-acetyltransferase n=1 Tax=Marinicella sediminis TaxID=1792834 RepID=A0ABV7JDK2_9GAMM|nr:GNAT family protein [Marinicella sediminis]
MNAFINQALKGQHVRLEPLQESHLPGLKMAVEDGQLWQLMVTSVPHPDQLSGFFQQAGKEQQAGVSRVYSTIEQATGQVIGSTRFLNTNWSHGRTEIGFTFIAQSHQRTAINTEAKYLMLGHAFEDLGFKRVAFRTDHLNQRSRRAIERLGAKYEGLLRNHMVMADGRVRDTVVYSIIAHEWPGIKSFLEERLR